MAENNKVHLTFEVTTSQSAEDLEVAFNTGGWNELSLRAAPQHYTLLSASLVEDDEDDEEEVDQSERTASKAGDPPNIAEKDKPVSVKGQPSPSAAIAEPHSDKTGDKPTEKSNPSPAEARKSESQKQ